MTLVVDTSDAELQSMAVIGAGTMGIGIAYVFAAAGWQTTVVEPNDSAAKRCVDDLSIAAADGVRRGRLTPETGRTLAKRVRRVRSIRDLRTGLRLIIETVPERLDLKLSVLESAEATGPDLLASNTSSLSIDELAASLKRPELFLGLHFFNPVWSLPLVEVVRGRFTGDAALASALMIVDVIGKEAAVVKDSPGFATSRLDLISALEAIRMVEEEVGSAEDIDRAIRLAYRHPIGPLRLSDIVGLDVRLDIARQLNQALGDRFQPPDLLVKMVEAGQLGQKSGQGFYEWHEEMKS